MPKKKLLFINGHLRAGGVERALTDILLHFDYSHYEVDLMLLEGQGNYTAELPKQVKVVNHDLRETYGPIASCLWRCIRKKDWFSLRMRLVLTLRKFLGIRALRLGRNLLSTGKNYDTVIAFRPGICAEIGIFAVKARRRICYWHHGKCELAPKAHREMEQTLEYMEALVTVSRGCREMLSAHFPGIAERISVVPNMVDVELLKKKAAGLKPRRPQTELWLLSVGRLSPEKNMLSCIDACSELRARGLQIFWTLIGEGEEKGRIEKKIIEMDLADIIELKEDCANPYPYMAAADIVVHPSKVESFSLTILEAMALEKPCVAVASLGPKEYLRDGENAFIVEADGMSIANGVLLALGKRNTWEKMRNEESNTAAQFMPERVISQLEKLL